ncbi:MAG: hypothetical protein GEU94_08915 [Micromonosporaceae bacterium]|nr:hypothetical protein [Micromonosporaceae bacterium]
MAAVLALAVGATFAAGAPAQAGGWATTLLDPLPDRLEPGRAYTVGYWVLQHGSHAYDGDLGKTALRLVDVAGRQTEYVGVPLREPAHYATAIVFPRRGTWRLYAVQGIFDDYEIGSVTIPGGVSVKATPTPMTFDDGHGSHWGAIRPPNVAAARHTGDAGPAVSGAAAARTADGGEPSGSVWPPALAGVMTLALLLAAGWRWRRHLTRSP